VGERNIFIENVEDVRTCRTEREKTRKNECKERRRETERVSWKKTYSDRKDGEGERKREDGGIHIVTERMEKEIERERRVGRKQREERETKGGGRNKKKRKIDGREREKRERDSRGRERERERKTKKRKRRK
jgi:hypothetical protein